MVLALFLTVRKALFSLPACQGKAHPRGCRGYTLAPRASQELISVESFWVAVSGPEFEWMGAPLSRWSAASPLTSNAWTTRALPFESRPQQTRQLKRNGALTARLGCCNNAPDPRLR